MYPSGVWRGYWEQEVYGRQPMEDFYLKFSNGEVTGQGVDVVGRFIFSGEYDTNTGRVLMVKQYLEKHQVLYDGTPDGEGCIHGRWTVVTRVCLDDRVLEYVSTGPFLLQPVLGRATGEEPIFEITK